VRANINLKAGLFRLWVVLSGFYAAVVGVGFASPLWIAIQNKTFRLSEVESGHLPSTMERVARVLAQEVPLALLPPLIILGLGVALSWAIKGFEFSPMGMDSAKTSR
jgi:hypothetical protein